MNERNFTGTWRLVSMSWIEADGSATHPLGEDATGYIVYTADGYMSVAISRRDRPRLGTTEVLGGSPEDRARAAEGYISYAGPYQVEGDRVLHRVELCLLPDWIGTVQERRYAFEGNRLTLRADPAPDGNSLPATLVWERV